MGSLGTHLVLAMGIVGSSLWGQWQRPPVDVEIVGMRMEDLQDLPLGSPAAGEQKSDAVVAPAARAPEPPKPSVTAGAEARPKARTARGPEVALADDNGGAAPPRPTSVRSYAPQGSRVTALLRIDRLRDTAYAPAVDALLIHLPDRRDLLEGTDIDLYRDVDAVLIATPNPLDARVTFLAVRHHLSDTAMRAALEKGARATDRKLTWRTERGRPFAERRSVTGTTPTTGSRDHRLIVLAAPRLVVVTPPAYRSLILRGRTAAGAGTRGAGGTGTGHEGGSSSSNGAGGAGGAGGNGEVGGAASAPDDGTGWTALLRRIDAEDSILPADAVAMVSAVDLFSARSLRAAIDVVPGTRGTVDEASPTGPTIMGLPVPRLMTATLGIKPQPFVDLDAEFASEGDAVRWEQEWPVLRRKLLTNPLIVLTGFSGLVGRATLSRASGTARLHVEATEAETLRVLELLAFQLTALRR